MKPFMMADEFESIMLQAGFIGDELGTRDVAIAFSQSLMT